jgi:DNA-binding response OmpR family regulator
VGRTGSSLNYKCMKVRAAIVIIKDWRERAFLRAELIEEGIRTFAVENMDEAKEWLSDPRVLPMIIIYDTQYQDNTSVDIEYLREYSGAPILILTSSAEKKTHEIENLGFKHIIPRPASIGDVAVRVKEIMKGV